LSQPSKLLLQFLEILIGEVFQIDQLIPCAFKGADYLVQLEMHCLGVTVLGVLNQKHHKECDDSRGRIDDELPRVGKMKGWARQDPDEDSKHRRTKRPSAAEHDSGTAREKPECVADDAKEIALALVFFYSFRLGFIHRLLSLFAREAEIARTQHVVSSGSSAQSALI